MTTATQPRPTMPAKDHSRERIVRPRSRFSDLWKAPLHDFPIRDEILFRYLHLSSDSDVIEVGPGSGFTAFRLLRQVHSLALVEVFPDAIEILKDALGSASNLQCVCADLAQPGLASRIPERFDALYALDMFEYVPDSRACLRNMAEVLRPGGELMITFPNVPPPKGDGVTWFETRSELEAQLAAAGFSQWSIRVVRLRPFSRSVYACLHEWPLHLYRRFRTRKQSAALPQKYNETWAFQSRSRFERWKAFIHLYWAVMGVVLRAGGSIFGEADVEKILGEQLVIRATR